MSWVRSPHWPFIFDVLIEIFTKYFFGAEGKVSQFVMHQFPTFISGIEPTTFVLLARRFFFSFFFFFIKIYYHITS
jgi:hypothetical protein